MDVVIDTNPTEDEAQIVIDGVLSYGLEQVKGELPSKYCVVLKDQGQVLGGAVGKGHVGQFYLEHLWVEGSYRGRGYGKQILRTVQSYAQAQGYSHVWLSTLSPRASGWYVSLGYELQGVIRGYVQGFDLHYLRLSI